MSFINSVHCTSFKGAFLPHGWEDISARCYILQEFISYLSQMGSVVFKLHPLSKNYIGNVIIQNLPALKEKQASG